MLETQLRPDDTIERCGVVLKNGKVVEIGNIAEDPAIAFDMDPVQLLKHVKSRNPPVETWHTHPGADPALSGADYEGFLAWPDLVHNIVGVRDGKVLVLRYRVEDGLVIVCD